MTGTFVSIVGLEYGVCSSSWTTSGGLATAYAASASIETVSERGVMVVVDKAWRWEGTDCLRPFNNISRNGSGAALANRTSAA